ncbi:MAG: M23 family metallopeptidase [Akkermansiaceae bacterium]|nr:M23 family metallopeptidase [Akkermansiaceae bacterium]NNM28611.1 M23 family metallopeptidase [Akkermansiaceae bacterium]
MPRLVLVLAVLLCGLGPGSARPLRLQLPTDNKAIFSGGGEAYYMYVDRTFEGRKSKPWEAGQYGFVRNLKRTEEGIIGTRFHEGIDIRPVKRDSSGRPLDAVRTIATGVVAYVNNSAKASNYGKYVVVEHNWGDGPFFSLYAHLAGIDVQPGQRVLGGFQLGTMGYTGSGITRTRAHLHLELNILLSLRFEDWHDHNYTDANPHGIHNGLNLVGLDIASLFVALKSDRNLSIPAYLKRTPVYYRVTVPRRGPLELAARYPWLRKGNHGRPSPSWEISFSGAGMPLAIAPSHRVVSKPLVTYVRTTRSRHEHFTRSRLTGTGRRASLTKSGQSYISLITGDFPARVPGTP